MQPINSLSQIPLRKLFLVTVTCKIVSSFLAWFLSSPWLLGFFIPLGFMTAYLFLGFRRSPHDVSDERFGDSCYYLGFVFTISSIAFSLFDIPDLDKAGRLSDVAVRFGAAMVSTFLGFIARVYLVGFRHESNEALQSLENQIIESANKLKTRLDLSHEAFSDFEEKIRTSVSDIETRIKMSTENVGLHLSQQMGEALKAIAQDVQALHTAAANKMNVAAEGLMTELSKCSQTLTADINKTQSHFLSVADQLESRLRNVTFPDDFFTKELAVPVSNMVANMTSLSDDLATLKKSVQTGAKGVSTALEQMEKAIGVPQSVHELIQQQKLVAKEVLASISSAGNAIDTSASLIKIQTATLTQLTTSMAGTQSAQEQMVASTRQIVLELSNAQKINTQVVENLGALIKSLERLPVDLRMQASLTNQPVAMPSTPNLPRPISTPPTTLSPGTTPINTSNAPKPEPRNQSSDPKPEPGKPSFWGGMFKR